MSEVKAAKRQTKRTEEKEWSFEEALAKLDTISEALSKEELPLEKAIALYAEGVELVGICNRKLESAERSIRQLQCNTDGELIESDFLSESGTES